MTQWTGQTLEPKLDRFEQALEPAPLQNTSYEQDVLGVLPTFEIRYDLRHTMVTSVKPGSCTRSGHDERCDGHAESRQPVAREES